MERGISGWGRSGLAALMLAAAALGLSGCTEGGLAGSLRAAGAGSSPDEFMVLPTKPLEMPENLASLPPPTPGQTSLADYQPRTDAIAGLTGRPGPRGTASAPALIARAGPADPQIRRTLAVEDAEYRRTHQGLFLERLFVRNKEALVYREMTLDATAAYEQMQARGVRVPPASPQALEDGVRAAPPPSVQPEVRGWRVPF